MKLMTADRRRTLLGVLLVVLAAATLVEYFVFQHGTAVRTACQARVNSAFAQVITLRGQLADEASAATLADQRATTTLIREVLSPPPGTSREQYQQDIEAARNRWDAAERRVAEMQKQIMAERKAHPFPPLPSRTCR